MNHSILLIFLFFTSQFSKSQTNLISNPSFEDSVGCPVGPDELYKALGWMSFGGSPDYMNSCSSGMSVPQNWGGYQPAASGNSYAAILTYSNTGPNTREFIGTELSSNLTIGVKYYISLKTSLSLGSSVDGNCASNNLGVQLSTFEYNVFTPIPINNNPMMSTNAIIIDSSGWVRLFGSFIADSSYNYIAIGNFYDDSNTDIIQFYSTFTDVAYYFIDDVCISTDSLFAATYNYLNITENTVTDVKIYPNPVSDYLSIESDNSTKIHYHLIDLSGKAVASGHIRTPHLLSLMDIDNGVYILILYTKNGSTIKKIIKQ